MPSSYNPRTSTGEFRRGSPRLKRSRTQMNSPTMIPHLPTGFKNMESQLQIDLGKSLFELAVYKAEIQSNRRIASANLIQRPCHCDPPYNCLGPYRPELPYRSTSRSSTYNQEGVILPRLSDGEKFETYMVNGRLDPVAINMKRVLQSSEPVEEIQSEAMAVDGDLSVLRNLEDVLESELFNNGDADGGDINHEAIAVREQIPVVEELSLTDRGEPPAPPPAETAAEEIQTQEVPASPTLLASGGDLAQDTDISTTRENTTQPVTTEDAAPKANSPEGKQNAKPDQEGRESPGSDKMKKKVTFEESEKPKKKPPSPKRSAKKKDKAEKVEKEKGEEKKDAAKEKSKDKTKEKSGSAKDKKEKGGKGKKVSSPKGKKGKKKAKEPEPEPEPEPEVVPEPEEIVKEIKEEIPPEPVIIEPQPPKYTLVSEYKSKYQMVREWLYASSEHMAARTVPIL